MARKTFITIQESHQPEENPPPLLRAHLKNNPEPAVEILREKFWDEKMVNLEYLMNLLPQMILVGLTDHEKSSKF